MMEMNAITKDREPMDEMAIPRLPIVYNNIFGNALKQNNIKLIQWRDIKKRSCILVQIMFLNLKSSKQ